MIVNFIIIRHHGSLIKFIINHWIFLQLTLVLFIILQLFQYDVFMLNPKICVQLTLVLFITEVHLGFFFTRSDRMRVSIFKTLICKTLIPSSPATYSRHMWPHSKLIFLKLYMTLNKSKVLDSYCDLEKFIKSARVVLWTQTVPSLSLLLSSLLLALCCNMSTESRPWDIISE